MPDAPVHEGEGREAERMRVQERLLTRGNTLGGVVASVLELLAHGREFESEQLRRYAGELREWTADVRAVASEERP